MNPDLLEVKRGAYQSASIRLVGMIHQLREMHEGAPVRNNRGGRALTIDGHLERIADQAYVVSVLLDELLDAAGVQDAEDDVV